MTRQRVFGLDFLRALAVMMVLVGHASFMFLPLTHRLEVWWMLGQLGVELFFVLSGFLIGAILADLAKSDSFPLRAFWTRRWLRTLPNYYLFLIINVLIARALDGAWPQAASYAVFMQNLAWPQPMFFIESWSLAVEEIFYLLAPLLVLACRGWIARHVRPMTLVLLGIGVLTGVRIAYVAWRDPHWDEAVRMVALVRLDAIAYGVVAMLLCRRPGGMPRRAVNALAWAGVIGVALSVWLYLALPKDTDWFARTLWFSLMSASFAAFLPAAAQWQRSGLPRPVETAARKLAVWSYALYLCQLATMRVMNAVFSGDAQTAVGCLSQAILFMAMAIAISALVYHFFEAPTLRLRDRWTRTAQTR